MLWISNTLVALVALVAVLLGGCTLSGVPPLPAEKREAMGRLGVATAHFAPAIVMDMTRGKGHSATRGASQAAAGIIAGGIQSGDGFGFLLSILLAPVAAAGGAVYGAVAGESAENVLSKTAQLDTIFSGAELQRLLTEELLRHARRSSQHIARSDLQGSLADGRWQDYRGEVDLDSVLEVGIRRIRLNDRGITNTEVNLQIDGFSRLVQVSDAAVLMEQNYSYRSIDRDLDAWGRNEGALVRKELVTAYGQIAGKIVDDYFIPVSRLSKAGDPMGATKPLPRFCFFCQAFLEPVPTSWPVLCWEPFNAERDQGGEEEPLLKEARAVVYDVSVTSLSGQSCYTRYDIDRNCYQIDTPLAPCQLHWWQVRARFLVGQTMSATPWVRDERNRFATSCP